MAIKKNLTNEKIKERFDNPFKMVNYAIELAGQLVRTGRGPRVKIDNQNPAVQVIAEISEGRDFLIDLADDDLQLDVDLFEKEAPAPVLIIGEEEPVKGRKTATESNEE